VELAAPPLRDPQAGLRHPLGILDSHAPPPEPTVLAKAEQAGDHETAAELERKDRCTAAEYRRALSRERL
jgi:hypothetical protein